MENTIAGSMIALLIQEGRICWLKTISLRTKKSYNLILLYSLLGNTAHHGAINGLTYTTDGLHLISCGTDNCIRLWDATSGKNCLINYGKIPNDTKKLVQLSVSTGCSPDVLFVPNRSNIDLFDIYTGEKIDRLKGHYNAVNCCKYHESTQNLYSGGNDRNILIWTPATDSAYDDYLKSQSTCSLKDDLPEIRSNGTTVMIDTWSSDEDD